MSKLKALICVGISASGKTTYAKSLDRTWINVNRDDLRFSLTGSSGWGEYKFNKNIESIVTSIQKSVVNEAQASGKNVVISDTNLNPSIRQGWVDFLEKLGYQVEIKHFPIKLEEAWKRDSLRPNGVGHDVIYSQWLRYVEQTEEVYTPNPDLPDTAIFDIDGTIAKMNRSPYEWGKVAEDEVRYEVVEYLKALKQGGYKIILLSGRDSVCRSDTMYWLDYNQIPYDGLFMREQGDNRPDTEIKKELFFTHVAPNCNVKICVDDRSVMVRMWASIKIPSVISVADPYKEF